MNDERACAGMREADYYCRRPGCTRYLCIGEAHFLISADAK